jgi:hypothetical protein
MDPKLSRRRAVSRRLSTKLSNRVSVTSSTPHLASRLIVLTLRQWRSEREKTPRASGSRTLPHRVAARSNAGHTCFGTYLFWDDIHPTTNAHAHLAEAALQALSLQQGG